MPKTRLVIYNVDVESGERQVFDIIEFNGRLALPELLLMLKRTRREGDTAAQSRAHWGWVLEELGRPQYPFVIEDIEG